MSKLIFERFEALTKKAIYLAMTFSLLGCVGQEESLKKNSDWETMGYSGFAEKINELSGPNAIDCGFFDLTTRAPDISKASELGILCAIQASKKGLPFKYGTKRIPTDSYAYEILLLTPEKIYWTVTLDVMLVESRGMQQWNKKCQSIKFTRENFQAVDCEEIKYKDWIVQ